MRGGRMYGYILFKLMFPMSIYLLQMDMSTNFWTSWKFATSYFWHIFSLMELLKVLWMPSSADCR